jgi:hypothetical protein
LLLKLLQHLLIWTVLKVWLDLLRCMIDLFRGIMILELLDLFVHFGITRPVCTFWNY